ncbi:MAG: Rne/Rng family ribonuclease [Candidatus Babeliaceae bacterium]
MKKILINVNPWQTRIAITREGYLQNLYLASHTTESLERSFFKGVVIKVLPGIQTAFVDIGQERAGFLHISEIDRELALQRMASGDQLEEIEEDDLEKTEQEHIPRKELDINKILHEKEHILVQVSKEPVYEKGAKLTTCFTLPGRFLVLMPNIPRIGISKKIEEREERQRLRELLLSNLPEGMGTIIRTTSEYRQAQEILQDLQYLLETWQTIQKNYAQAKPGEKIYEDIDMRLQAVRDHLDNDVDAVLIDNQETQSLVYKFVKHIAPEHAQKIKFYQGPPALFDKYEIEGQIEQALQKKVHLKSGGFLIIESTEAMTVIDVNTGRYIGVANLEETILKTNLEAAEEIVHQLRLRNIGGLIVIDFIDMTNTGNRQKLFKYLEKMLKERDKFQSVVLRVSEFGLVQMTRKRSGKTLLQQMMNTCSACAGNGIIKSLATQTYHILRQFKNELENKQLKGDIILAVHPHVFDFIIHHEYNAVLALEKNFKCKITLTTKESSALDIYTLETAA